MTLIDEFVSTPGWEAVAKRHIESYAAQKSGTNTVDVANSTNTGINSAKAGIAGESLMEQILRQLPDEFVVVNSSSRRASADFQIIFRGCKILLDVKNYTRPVPWTEVEKLKRDIEETSAADVGLMISLQSPIANVNQFTVLVDHECHEKPVILASELSTINLMTEILVRFAGFMAFRLRLLRGGEDYGTNKSEIAALCGRVVNRLSRLSEIRAQANVIRNSANIIDVQSQMLEQEIQSLFGNTALQTLPNPDFDFGVKIPKKYTAAIKSICTQVRPVHAERNIWNVGNKFIRITKTKITKSTNINAPATSWIDLNSTDDLPSSGEEMT